MIMLKECLSLILALAFVSVFCISGCVSVNPPALPPLPPGANTSRQQVMAESVVISQNKVVTLAADYDPTSIIGLTAFCDVKTNSDASWQRIASLPYPTSGGTFAAPYTNTTPQFVSRFGYHFPPR